MTDDLHVWAARGLQHTSRTGELDLNDRATCLILAVDYALGRMTYAVDDVTRAVIRNPDVLTAVQRREMADQILAALTEKQAGMACDTRQWWAVVHALTATEATP